MKRLIPILLLVVLISCAGPREATIDYSQFSKINQVESGKDTTFVRLRDWMTRTYGSAKGAIELEDKASGKLIGKGQVQYFKLAQTDIHYTIVFEVKDQRYRMSFERIYATGANGEQNAVMTEPWVERIQTEFTTINSSALTFAQSSKRDEF